MFVFDNFRRAINDDGFYAEPQMLNFDRERESATDRLAWQLTGVAVNKIAEPTLRKRARLLVASKVASRVTINEASGSEEVRSAHKAWMRFATRSLEMANIPKLISLQKREPERGFGTFALLHLGYHLTEPPVALKLPAREPLVELISPPQKREPVNPAFQAKPDLITAWLDGLNALRVEAGHEALLPVSSKTQEVYAAELTRQLRKVISNFAKRKAYDGGAYRITFGKEFLPSIESLMEDHLMLPPRNAVEFLDILKRELYDQSSDRAVFSGRWGELNVDDDGELVLNLQKRRSRKLSSLLRGK